MSTKILVPLEVDVDQGISLTEEFSYDAEAYDVIEIQLAPGATDIEVDINPMVLAAAVHLLAIQCDVYKEVSTSNVSFKVHSAANPAIKLDSALMLTGPGAVATLLAAPDKLFFANTGAIAKNVTIMIARDATP